MRLHSVFILFHLAKAELLLSVWSKLILNSHTHTRTLTHIQKHTQMNQTGICKGYRTDIWWVSEGCNDLFCFYWNIELLWRPLTVCVCVVCVCVCLCVLCVFVCACTRRSTTAVKNKWGRCVPWVSVECQSSLPLHLTASTQMVRHLVRPLTHTHTHTHTHLYTHKVCYSECCMYKFKVQDVS